MIKRIGNKWICFPLCESMSVTVWVSERQKNKKHAKEVVRSTILIDMNCVSGSIKPERHVRTASKSTNKSQCMQRKLRHFSAVVFPHTHTHNIFHLFLLPSFTYFSSECSLMSSFVGCACPPIGMTFCVCVFILFIFLHSFHFSPLHSLPNYICFLWTRSDNIIFHTFVC